MSEIATLSDADPETNRLVAKRRRAIATHKLTADYPGTTRNDAGDTVREVTTDDPTADTAEINLTQMFGPAVSRTGDVDLLYLEAELAADGRIGSNPHTPIDAATREQARDRIEANDLTPAWEGVDQ